MASSSAEAGYNTFSDADRLELLKSHLFDPVPSVWLEPFHESWIGSGDINHYIRMARAHASEMSAAQPFICPGEIIIGNDSLKSVVHGRGGAGIHFDREYLEQLKIERPDEAALLREIEDYWPSWLTANQPHGPIATHAPAGYEMALELGLDGLRDFVNDCREINVRAKPDMEPWYEALLITLTGISDYISAHARAAEIAMSSESNNIRRMELEGMVHNCRFIAHNKPQSFRQAVQLYYLLFLVAGHDSPGPIDRILGPYLDRDLLDHRLTMDSAQLIVDCLWLKLHEKTAYWVTLGGQKSDKSDACGNMTMLCLKAIDKLQALSPQTVFRWHSGVSRDVLRMACKPVIDGATFPSFLNDETIIPSMVSRGIAPEYAAEYTFVGCGHVFPNSSEHCNYEDIILNAVKPLELALNNGTDPVTGEKTGPETGDVATFATFEQFERAYQRQMNHQIAACITWVNEFRLKLKDYTCNFVRSLFFHSYIEHGLDWGGMDYSEGMVDIVGLATVTDSLLAIKQGVYAEEKLSLHELVAILNSNWKGEEDLRRHLLNSIAKFNNDKETDSPVEKEAYRINKFIDSRKTVFGGPWRLNIMGLKNNAVAFGKNAGATPDGRHRGEPVVDYTKITQVKHIPDFTKMFLSVAQLPYVETHSPLALGLRFPRSIVSESDGLNQLAAMIEMYFKKGGQYAQCLMDEPREIKDAPRKPIKQEPIAQITGFNAEFSICTRGL
ncbi:MAG: hypothetical protein JXN60_04820 [Lentisphaerae bacterium]|nr:hypothetical protein [Lentisphaerota bacterium]